MQVIKEPALCFSFCLGVTRDKAHDYYSHSLMSTWVERPARHIRNQMMQQSLLAGHCRGTVIAEERHHLCTGKVPLGPASHGWHPEHCPTNTHTPVTGVISAPRGLAVCTDGPLNHEAKALQPLFAEHLLLC